MSLKSWSCVVIVDREVDRGSWLPFWTANLWTANLRTANLWTAILASYDLEFSQ
ncbi:MAG: hypothetical protein VXW26_17220 [SAR324 cluster bacterium]|nr:hypothetical protein [SAR324 cluster bacterium]